MRLVQFYKIFIPYNANTFIDCYIYPMSQGIGMSEPQKLICDEFVYIPQYGNGTASLNVNVATALVLHHYVEWDFKQQQKCQVQL